MARRYTGHGSAAVGTNLTILTLVSAATIRPKLYDMIIGCVATPADQATSFHLERFTAIGTEATGFTPIAIDPGDPASLADCGVGAFSVEPTYTANAHLMSLSMNQRNTFRWVAFPGGELVAPATAGNGIGLQSQSGTGSAAHEATFYWEE
jgi:hypothetical protein